MPNMSGKELSERIRERQPHVEVLFVSGYTENTILHRGVLDPGTHMLQKPFTPDVLGRAVREILDQRAKNRSMS